MLRGLQLAKEKGFKKLIMNVDSIIIVGLLKGSMMCNACHSSIIQRCKGLLASTNWEVMVSHCFREVNQVANVLTNKGVNLNIDFAYVSEPPREVLNV